MDGGEGERERVEGEGEGGEAFSTSPSASCTNENSCHVSCEFLFPVSHTVKPAYLSLAPALPRPTPVLPCLPCLALFCFASRLFHCRLTPRLPFHAVTPFPTRDIEDMNKAGIVQRHRRDHVGC